MKLVLVLMFLIGLVVIVHSVWKADRRLRDHAINHPKDRGKTRNPDHWGDNRKKP